VSRLRIASLDVVRALAAVSLALIVAGPATAQSPEPSAALGSPVPSAEPGSPEPTSGAIVVTLVDFALSPDPVIVASERVDLLVVNDGITPHNLSIRDAAGALLAATPDLSQGESAPLSVTLPESGTYAMFCSLPGHESLGLKGELVVTGDEVASPSPAATVAAA
jgi:plastocyanin